MTWRSDHNLLFGIIALQLDFIQRDQLLKAVDTWLLDKTRRIDEIMVEQSSLDADDRALLAPLVERHLKNHGYDSRKSLASLSSIGSLADALHSLGDEQIDATLSNVSSEEQTANFDETAPYQGLSKELGSAAGTEGRELRYRILRPHAKGGLGEVSVARDVELNRDVALKEIQSRFADDEASRSRFLLEAEVTGGLEHPGIVPVYGLGRYSDGRPFYAMRFIKGDSLQEAADRFHGKRSESESKKQIEEQPRIDVATAPNRPQAAGQGGVEFDGVEFRQLLGRFVDVCQAIAYAHSRGVLHRDLKPGNIMIGKYGETLVVDWGLAKTREVDDADRSTGELELRPASASGSVPTLMGSALGTPSYMPPEQAAGRLDELGPASDVYALGATLFYLLTGKTPIQGKDIKEVLEAVQVGRFSAPSVVRPGVPKSLEAICLKAMALRPDNRYPSPQHLSDDVERFLADEPVSAYTEPVLLRTRRWMRKRPKLVASIAATLLVGLSSAMVISVVVAKKNSELALKNQEVIESNDQLIQANDNERQARAKAESRLAQIKKSNEVLGSIFRGLDPEQVNESDLMLRDALVANLESVMKQLALDTLSDPLMVVEAQQTLGETLIGLTEFDKAIEVLESARAIRLKMLGMAHPDTLQSMNNLAIAYDEAGQFDRAMSLHQETLQQRTSALGADDPQTLVSMNNLANTYRSAGQYEEAIALHAKALAMQETIMGLAHNDTLITMSNLASDYFEKGQVDRAVELWEKELALTEANLGPAHPSTLTSMNNLAVAYQALGQTSKAMSLSERVLEQQKTTLGLDHSHTLTSMNNLANILHDAGRLDEAVSLLQQTIELQTGKQGPDHPTTLQYVTNLADVYMDAGQLTPALSLHERVLASSEAALGIEHPQTARCRNGLAAAYYLAGRVDKALVLQEKILEQTQRNLGPDHPATVSAMNNLANSYSASGEVDKALPLLEQARKWAHDTLGEDHPNTLLLTSNLATSHVEAGQMEIALQLYEPTAELMKEKLGPDHFLTLDTFGKVGRTYLELGRTEEALPLLERAYRERDDPRMKFRHGTHLFRVYEKLGDSTHAAALTDELSNSMLAQLSELSTRVSVADQLMKFAHYLIQAEAFDDAEPLLRESLAVKQELLPDAWETFDTQSALGEVYQRQERYAEAEPLLLAGHQGLLDRQDTLPTRRKTRLAESTGRLVRLYQAWHTVEPERGFDAQASQWQRQLD